ncbi:uncharacterized protein EHS24_000899 [Apiotrichum porosum]|uniref:Uncharacterized protein n=1 Tax=Apiotrichum porosum TaxID=105984 RepID=A0A427YB43_9TREE|nr:uncharacterized protein EHS24_000899 [Apiotrichum porosum]RSH88360.1 hypothetical protein EHS24_000899 [Apiotrichum porosum]
MRTDAEIQTLNARRTHPDFRKDFAGSVNISPLEEHRAKKRAEDQAYQEKRKGADTTKPGPSKKQKD